MPALADYELPDHTDDRERPSAPQRTFRSDFGSLVQLDLDVQEYADPENDPLIPHTGPLDARRWQI